MKVPLLHLWRDFAFRPASANMALDEALFRWAIQQGEASARFYSWDHEARTRGYFQRDMHESHGEIAGGAASVRRYTGGGLVEHGEDLTFVLALPAGSLPASLAAEERYRWIHKALAHALASAGCVFSSIGAANGSGRGPCFDNPVPWDLVDPKTGTKVAGGAQRRSHGAVIHQGSIRLPPALRHPGAEWIVDFVDRLAERSTGLEPEARRQIELDARDLVEARYGHEGWNRQFAGPSQGR